VAEKPADFFLGALDFFGILVPGVVCLAAILIVDPQTVGPVVKLLPSSGAERTIALAVSAYLLGYALHVAGFAVDRLYDAMQQRAFERFYGRELYNRVMSLKKSQLSAEDANLISGYRWALTNIRMRFPAWAADIDRMTAHTALFRSMTLIAAVTTVVVLAKKAWIGALLGAITTAISIRLYQHLRWQSIRTVYEYYVALNAVPRRVVAVQSGEGVKPAGDERDTA
jgi:hypothetical protein